jgi:hypothetical protein
MSTTSMSLRATTERQSVADSSQPNSAAAASTLRFVRPQITRMRGWRRGEKNRETCRYAFECALPMNA